jgi:Zn-dependent peptidase ImmA (M78 family)
MINQKVVNRFNDVKNMANDDGLLDYYVKKTRDYMAEKFGKQKFQIIKRTTKFTDVLKKTEGRVDIFEDYNGVIINYSEGKDDLVKRGVIAHELGHVAMHYELIEQKIEMQDEHEKEATDFAELVLKDHSVHYDNLPDSYYTRESHVVGDDAIKKVLKKIYKKHE